MSIYKETIKRFLVGGKAQAQVTRTTELDLAQFYADCASLGVTMDVTLFENSLKALPEVARNEAINYLVPGAYKLGMIYGFNSDTKSVSPFPFSRTSSATYIDKNGIMQVAPANIPRIDYDPMTGECRGYLQEAASTNLCRWSNKFDNWSNGLNTISILSGVNTSYGKPMWAVSKVNSVVNSPVSSIVTLSTANTTYCLRVTLRAGTSDKIAVGIRSIEDDGGTGIWGSNENCTFRKIQGVGAISRINTGSLTLVTGLSASSDTVIEITRKYINGGISVSAYIYPDSPASTVVGASNLVSCAQLETTGACTSYIETGAEVAIRTADFFSSKNDIVPFNSTSIFMNFAPDFMKLGDSSIILSKGTSGRFLYVADAAGTSYGIGDGTAIAAVNNFPIDGSPVKFISGYSPVKLVLAANGVISTRAITVSSFGSGRLIFGETRLTKNHIKAIAIIPRQLTNAEHITATTL